MKRPLASVAALYIAGVFAADQLSPPLPALFVAAFIIIGSALFWPRGRLYLLASLLFIAGAANLVYRSAIISPNDLRLVTSGDPALVQLRGRLIESPSARIHDRDKAASLHVLAEMTVSALREHDEPWRAATGYVVTSTTGSLPAAFTRGAAVEVSGVLESPKRALAEGLFDYAAYLRRHCVYRHLRCSGPDDWKLANPKQSVSWSDRFVTWAQATLGRGLVRDQSLELVWAMILGWRAGLTGDVSEAFMRSGTIHVFAISGLHIVLIAAALVAMFRVLLIRRAQCAWIVIPILWFYTGATGWQASAVRSTVMSSVVIAGWAMKRPSDMLNSLAAAALIILVWDPLQLFQAGFLLSFAVVLSLGIFSPVLHGVQGYLLRPDSLRAPTLEPRWMKRLRWWASKAGTAFVTSLAAWLGSIPLIAMYFHLFTPVSLFANLVIVPLSSLALVSSTLSLIAGPLIPVLGEIFNHSSWFVMLSMVKLSEWFAKLPGGCFYVPGPGILFVLGYYGALVAVMLGWFRKPGLRVWLVVVLGAITLCWALQRFLSKAPTQITVLPLARSHCIYAQESSGVWLIDCGNDDEARYATKPFVAAKGFNKLPHLILTHGDADHVSGAAVLQNTFTLGGVSVPDFRFRSSPYRQLESSLSRRAKTFDRLTAGNKIGPWTILHPAKQDRFTHADDAALVLSARWEDTTVLLLSDLGRAGQQALLKRTPRLKADIVVTGWPASGEPLAEALLEAIAPSLVVLGESPKPFSERRVAALKTRLAKRGIEVLDTRATGAVTLQFSHRRWKFQTMNPVRPNPVQDALFGHPQSGPEE